MSIQNNFVQVDIRMGHIHVVDDTDHRPYQPVQYLATDKHHRIRARKAYNKATQRSSIDFINHLLKQMATPIHCIRTDNSLVFGREFREHLETLGVRHEHIAPSTPFKI